jgi:hypothetical protein
LKRKNERKKKLAARGSRVGESDGGARWQPVGGQQHIPLLPDPLASASTIQKL